MILTDEQKGVVRALREASASASDFATLVALAGLDPSRDFRHANLRGVDFGAADLAGFDFTGADLTGADMSRARTAGAVFGDAGVGGVDEEGAPLITLRPYQRRAVEAIVSHLRAGHPRAIATMALGTGKSTVLAGAIERLSKESDFEAVLVVVRSLAIVEHLVAMFRRPSPGEVGALSGVDVMFCEPNQLSALADGDVRSFSHVFYLDLGLSLGYSSKRSIINGAKKIFIYSECMFKYGDEGAPGLMLPRDVVFKYSVGGGISDGYLLPISRINVPSLRGRILSHGDYSFYINDFMDRMLDDSEEFATSIIVCDNYSEYDLIDRYNRIARNRILDSGQETKAFHHDERWSRQRNYRFPVFVYPFDKLSERDLVGVSNVAVLSYTAPACVLQDWSVPIDPAYPHRKVKFLDYTGAATRS
jgi:hypothetical protein